MTLQAHILSLINAARQMEERSPPGAPRDAWMAVLEHAEHMRRLISTACSAFSEASQVELVQFPTDGTLMHEAICDWIALHSMPYAVAVSPVGTQRLFHSWNVIGGSVDGYVAVTPFGLLQVWCDNTLTDDEFSVYGITKS